MTATPARVLGISAWYHDAAAALVIDGAISAASQEERFTRVKGDASFPHHAVASCLDIAGIDLDAIDHVVFYEEPAAKLDRLLTVYLADAPRGLRSFLRAMPSWLTKKLWLAHEVATELQLKRTVHTCDHHLSHAASAFLPSPYEEAAILTIDGVGEWSTATWGVGRGNSVELRQQLRFPNSLGLLYSAFTSFCGFKINSGEYKLMGLAPYGEPRFADLIRRELCDVDAHGAVILNQRYFDYVGGLQMTHARFAALFGGPARAAEDTITQREMDLAASVQAVVDEVVLRMARHVRAETGLRHLCLAGGVALNGVAIGKLSAAGVFDDLWIQPAAGDAGGALGAALWFSHQVLGLPRRIDPHHEMNDQMNGALLGPAIHPADVGDDAVLTRMGGVWDALDDVALATRIADDVAAGKVVALARGRMELGPRALGARSILGDARSSSMQSHMNHKIKFREGFRPFAPIVLEERAQEYFDLAQPSPYMNLVYPVAAARRTADDGTPRRGFDRLSTARSDIPAVTHVDHSARIQTVAAHRHPFLHDVLVRFHQKTGCAVMINTSFNVRGEPIVCTAEDAYRCFMATEIDSLVVGNRHFSRERQRARPTSNEERSAWLRRFELD